jgi:hypothetical protein
MSEPEGDSKVGLLLKDGVLVATVPALGYLCAYLYEMGFANYFRLPADFVAVDLRALLSAAVGIAFVFFIGMAIVSFVSLRFSAKGHPLLLLLGRYWPLFVVLGFVHTTVQSTDWRWQVATVGCIILFSLEFLFPLFARNQDKNYRERFAARQTELSNQRGLLGQHLGISEHAVALLLFSAFLLFVGCYEWGVAEAMRKKRFLVPANRVNTVILGVYDKNLMMAEYDPKTKELKPKRTLVILSDNQEFNFDYKTLGSLRVKRPEGGWRE